jgi:soluble lytic murein transglycosylase-like protein
MSCEQYKPLILEKADKFGIDRTIALKQIKQESNCNPRVCSHAGACGIAQFIAGTAQRFGLQDRFDPEESMEAWGKYMSHLLRLFKGDYSKALAGYNMGEGGESRRNGVIGLVMKYGSSWLNHAPRETRNYVAIILAGTDRVVTVRLPGGSDSNFVFGLE